MTADLRDRQFRQCCDALEQVSADAPTLCEGWAAHDLAIHLWTLKHDPLGWPGIVVPALAATTARRADRIRRRWSYVELVARLRAERGDMACMPFDRFGGHRHALGEYYTPDWLCERIAADLHLERHFQVLDPACGSGAFLFSALQVLQPSVVHISPPISMR